jgi:hypothetical protein
MKWTLGAFTDIMTGSHGEDSVVFGYWLRNPTGRDHVFVPSKFGGNSAPDHVKKILDKLNSE